MKKIAVALPYAVSIRDFVNSGAFEELLRDVRVEVSIYTLNPDIPELEAVRSKGVRIHQFSAYQNTRGEQLLKSLYPLFFIDQFANVRLAVSDRPLHRGVSKCLSCFRRIIGTGRLLKLIGAVLLMLHRQTRPTNQLEDGLSLFVGMRSLINSLDYGLLAEATARGIPVLTLAGSWDNFTTKGYFPFPAKRTVVWNRKMQEELLDIFGVKADHIRIVGYPRAALLRNSVSDTPAWEYLESIGIHGYRRFVLYSASYGELTRVTGQPVPLEYVTIAKVCECLLPTLPIDVCVIVRMHPFSKAEDKSHFMRIPRCFVYVPGRQDKYVERVMGRDDERHLAMQIAKAECVVSMASTMSIDALCLHKPILNIDFDPYEGIPYSASIRRFYEFNHFRDLVRISGLPLAKSTDDVLDFVRSCLQGSYQSPVDLDAFEQMYVPHASAAYPQAIRKTVEELIHE